MNITKRHYRLKGLIIEDKRKYYLNPLLVLTDKKKRTDYVKLCSINFVTWVNNIHTITPHSIHHFKVITDIFKGEI